MAAAASTHVEGDECMEDIQTRTEKLDISNPVEEKPMTPGENINRPECTCNTDDEGDERMPDEFPIADPEGEEPVRWDFVDVDESQPGQMEIHVEFNNGMWWHMPYYLSDGILAQWKNVYQQVSFVWDWENTRKGSFELNGAETSFNRYVIDFDIMQQRNTDNGRTRRVKVVSVIRGSNRPL